MKIYLSILLIGLLAGCASGPDAFYPTGMACQTRDDSRAYYFFPYEQRRLTGDGKITSEEETGGASVPLELLIMRGR